MNIDEAATLIEKSDLRKYEGQVPEINIEDWQEKKHANHEYGFILNLGPEKGKIFIPGKKWPEENQPYIPERDTDDGDAFFTKKDRRKEVFEYLLVFGMAFVITGMMFIFITF